MINVEAKKLWDEVEEMSGVSLQNMPVGRQFGWYDKRLFAVGEPIPLKPSLVAFAMFQDEDEVRVYATMIQGAAGEPQAPHRFTLSKRGPTVFIELMNLDVLKAELAGELSALVNPDEPDEPDETVKPDDPDDPDETVKPVENTTTVETIL